MLKKIKEEINTEVNKEISKKKAIIFLSIEIMTVIIFVIAAIKFRFIESLLMTEIIIPLGILLVAIGIIWIFKKVHK